MSIIGCVMRRLALHVFLLGVVAACSGGPTTTPLALTDGQRVWCSDWANQQKVGLAAITLGVDREPVTSLAIGSTSDGDVTLSETLRYWADGGDAANPLIADLIPRSTMQKNYADVLVAWEAGSPDSFVRTCNAAFAGRT